MLTILPQRTRLFILIGLFLFPTFAAAQSVNDFDDLLALITNGNKMKEPEAKQVIESAQQAVAQDHGGSRARDIEFGKPIQVIRFGSAYSAISFAATEKRLSRRAKIVFSILFEQESKNSIAYSDHYLPWAGDKLIRKYNTLSDLQICHLFQNKSGMTLCPVSDDTAETTPDSNENKFSIYDEKLALKADSNHTHKAEDITSGVLNEARIDQALVRDKELAAILQKKFKTLEKRSQEQPPVAVAAPEEIKNLDSKIVKQGESVAALKSQIANLEKTVHELAALLEGVSRNGHNIVFSGINVQIVNGTGSTEGKVNGQGNLIVGYNEPRSKGNPGHSGSHNIVVGTKNTYSSYGGMVVGISNSISGKFSTVSGGSGNSASGSFSSVSGGHLNRAKGDYSNVSGGLSRSTTDANGWRGGDQSSGQ